MRQEGLSSPVILVGSGGHVKRADTVSHRVVIASAGRRYTEIGAETGRRTKEQRSLGLTTNQDRVLYTCLISLVSSKGCGTIAVMRFVVAGAIHILKAETISPFPGESGWRQVG